MSWLKCEIDQDASPMQVTEKPLNLRNLNQRGCKQGNINPLVCALRFYASAKIFSGANNCCCLRCRLNAVLFKNSK